MEKNVIWYPQCMLTNQLHNRSDNIEHHNVRTFVVWGLGGAEKTQLALDHLQRHRSEYEVTFWIEAGSKEPIEHDFMHIYQSLFDVWMPAGQEMFNPPSEKQI